MSTTRTCDRCGSVVPASAPHDLCPRCLFDTAVDADADTSSAQSPAKTTVRSVEQTTPPPFFGDYELLGELGRGGQAVVYRTRHRGLGRLVALKTIPPDRDCYTKACLQPRLEIISRNIQFLVNELGRLNANDALLAGRLDLERLGAFGFSWGNVGMAEFARIDPRCKAVVLLDAGPLLD